MVKRVVDTDFWTNPQVIDSYSVEDKFFALYLMTNGRSTQVGIYSLPKKVISFESGYTTDVIQVLIDRFSDKYGEIIYSEKTQEVTLLNSLSYSVLTGGKPVLDLLKRELRAVEDGSLILATYHAMKEYWSSSVRKFDQTIQEIFEKELSIRELLHPEQHNQNQNQTHTQKQSHNHIQNKNQNQNHNHNHNHNHNQDSSITTRGTTREKVVKNESENDALKRYIQYLKHKKPGFKQEIHAENILSVFYQELLGEVTLAVQDKLNAWEKILPKSVILEALVRSEDKFKPISYAETVITNWLENGVENTKDIALLDRAYSRETIKKGEERS